MGLQRRDSDARRDARRSPTMYYSEFTKGIMRHPDVLNMINQDFYVAPLSHEDPTEKQTTSLELHQGSPLEHDGMTLTYTDFTFTGRGA